MTDAENRIQIIRRLLQALYAELEMVPVALRNEICQKIVSGVMSLWEATGDPKNPLMPFKLNSDKPLIDHYYCNACGKPMNQRNGKVRKQMRLRSIILPVLLLLSGCATDRKPTVRRSMPPPEALAATGGFTISPTSASASVSGGTGAISLTATWSASSSDPTWLTVTPTSGNGSTMLSWSAAPNTGPARSGTLAIADKTFSVTQAGTSGGFEIGLTNGIPFSDSLTATANQTVWKYYYIDVPTGATSLVVDTYNMSADVDMYVRFGDKPTISLWNCRPYMGGTSEKCTLNAPSAGRWWIGVLNWATGTIQFTVKGTIVTSSACVYGVTASVVAFNPDGGAGTATVTTAPECAWSTASSVPWMTVGSGGNGNGTVNYTVASNTSTNQRIGALTVADKLFTITQAGSTVVPPATNQIVKRFGGLGSDSGEAVAFDANGNMIFAGQFQGTVNFGTGDLVALGADLCLVKVSPAGLTLWAKRYGASGNETVKTIALDGSGNIFLGGSFSGQGNFGGSNLNSGGDADAFLAKYSAQGDHLWSLSFGGVSTEKITRLVVDSQGNVIAAGDFQATLAPILIGTNALLSHSQADVFISKFSPNGANIWGKSFFCANINRGTGVCVDQSGNIVLAGYFQGSIDFSSQTAFTANALTVPGSFLAKFTPAGAHIQSRALGTNFPSSATAMVVDASGDAVIAGGFHAHTDLGAGQVFGTSFNSDAFVAKYAPDFSYKWATLIKGNAAIGVSSLTVDAQGNVYVAGFLTGAYNFGAQAVNAGNSSSDGFVAKYSSAGGNAWAKDLGTVAFPNSSTGSALALGNNVALTGSFQGTAAVGGSSIVSAGGLDILLWQLAQ